MTKFHATLVLPLSQQADRDGQRIDPTGLRFDPSTEHLIFLGFNYEIPKDVVGHGRVSRAEDGSLVMNGELSYPYDAKLAVGALVDQMENGVMLAGDLVSIGLVHAHPDPAQPFIEREDRHGRQPGAPEEGRQGPDRDQGDPDPGQDR